MGFTSFTLLPITECRNLTLGSETHKELFHLLLYEHVRRLVVSRGSSLSYKSNLSHLSSFGCMIV